MRRRSAIALGLAVILGVAIPPADSSVHRVPLFPSASDPAREGFVRVINLSDREGEVSVIAIDDAGWRSGEVVLTLGAGAVAHFNSDDLEQGNANKGLSGGIGAAGQGDWRLELASDLDLGVLAYIRTEDGLLTAMHDVVARGLIGHRVAIFNPGANRNQKSLLRLINPGAEAAEVSITGIDDSGAKSTSESGGLVRITLPAGGARTLSAAELEAESNRAHAVPPTEVAGPLTGELGDGTGKWQLLVMSEKPVVAMNLLVSPTGHLTNLSTAPHRMASADNEIRRMAENTEAGVPIGEPVTADLGTDTVPTHALEGPDAEAFGIDAASGQLVAGEGVNYDFETRSSLEVVVVVTDGLGGVVRIPVTVELTDVDEPPGKPAPPEVEGVSSRSVLVRWEEPDNTGPPINDYDVEYRRPGAVEHTDAGHEGTGREIEITHLRQGADYEFRIRATNAEGIGDWSDATTGRARTGGGGGGGGGGVTPPPPPPPPPPPSTTNEPPEFGTATYSFDLSEGIALAGPVGDPLTADRLRRRCPQVQPERRGCRRIRYRCEYRPAFDLDGRALRL